MTTGCCSAGLNRTGVLGVAFLACLMGYGVRAAAPTLEFVSPGGGEVFIIGQTQNIKINSKFKKVIIELSRDGGPFDAVGTIDNSVKDKSKLNLLVNTVAGPASSNCVMRARGQSTKGDTVATSAVFSIGVGKDLGGVATNDLADGAVTTPKLADKAVTAPKIGSGQSSGNMVLTADGLGGAKFLPLVVTMNDLADGSVTTPKLAEKAVTVEKINPAAALSNTVLTADGTGGVSFTQLVSSIQPASAANTPNTLVLRDGSGNFLAGTITADLTGTASNATNFNGQPASAYSLATHDHFGQTWNGSSSTSGLTVANADTTGNSVGVQGTDASATGAGVFGHALATTGSNAGVAGETESTTGIGVFGTTTATSGKNYGVFGESASPDGVAVNGLATSSSGQSKGVSGLSLSTEGYGVYGLTTATTGDTAGIYGQADSNTGTGVQGFATAAAGNTSGVYGQADSDTGTGVQGFATAATGNTSGVYGQADSSTGTGVQGFATAATGNTSGVYGQADSDTGAGILGIATAITGNTNGVYGQADSSTGTGVQGFATAATGNTSGVYGQADSSTGTGVLGFATAATGDTTGIYGQADSTSGVGVFGGASAASGTTNGVLGQSASPDGAGVFGSALAASGTATGVNGQSASIDGSGVFGLASATSGVNAGVVGRTNSTTGYGVYGVASATSGVNAGIYGTTNSPAGWAGYFNGSVNVTGNLSKASGTFKIDHPLDPANKYLFHSFVESPDMKNIYDGVAVLDKKGATWVELPAYFEALNRDFRYQLTCIGGFAPVFIGKEISGNRFQIAGGKPGMKVSWQVTGARQDAYAKAHPIEVEQEKSTEDRGHYLHPKEYGQPEEKGIAPATFSKGLTMADKKPPLY